MTVANSNNRTRLAISGLTYDFTFKIDDESEILVYLITDDVADLQVLTTDYTVSISSVVEGGTVTLTGASSADEILMVRNKEYIQSADIPARGGFNEPVIEGALDDLAMQIQQLKELLDYSVKQDSTAVQLDIVLPTPQDGYALGWDGISGAMQNLAVDSEAIADSLATAAASAAAAAASQSAAASSASAASSSASAAAASAVAAAASEVAAALPHAVDRGDPSAADFTTGGLTKDGTYYDMDLSSLIPAGAVMAILRVVIQSDTANKSVLFREKGNSNVLNTGQIVATVVNVLFAQDLIITLGSGRVIQYAAASGATWTTLSVTVAGYLK